MLMTDGLAELFDPANKMFGYKRIESALSEMGGNATPDQIIDRLNRDAENWLRGRAQNDDMTFFVFKRNLIEDKKRPEKHHKEIT